MRRAEEFPWFSVLSFGHAVVAKVELCVAVRAAEAGPMKEHSIGRHSLHQIHTLATEEAHVTGSGGGTKRRYRTWGGTTTSRLWRERERERTHETVQYIVPVTCELLAN